MYSLSVFPYAKWIVLASLIPFYLFLFNGKHDKRILSASLILLGLVCTRLFLFDILNVTDFKGRYTQVTIEVLFLLSFAWLCISLFKDKIAAYKKVIVSLIALVIILAAALELLLLAVGGFRLDYTAEKYYKLDYKLMIRKNYIDYGWPIAYEAIESKYLLFERHRALRELNDPSGEIDRIKLISYKDQQLVLAVYKKASAYPVTVLMKYDDVSSSSYGYRLACRNRKYGFIDKWNREMIPLEYDYLEGFQPDGTCRAMKDGKLVYIDTKNKIIRRK